MTTEQLECMYQKAYSKQLHCMKLKDSVNFWRFTLIANRILTAKLGKI